MIHESGEEKCPDVSVTAAKKSVLSWLQEPEKMMDPAQEEPRVLYRFLSSEKETEAEMENLAKAVAYSYKKGEIGRTAARELYGTLLRGSVTRMEGYAACAYSHFLNHGLGLRAGKEYGARSFRYGKSVSPVARYVFQKYPGSRGRISERSRMRSGGLW